MPLVFNTRKTCLPGLLTLDWRAGCKFLPGKVAVGGNHTQPVAVEG